MKNFILKIYSKIKSYLNKDLNIDIIVNNYIKCENFYTIKDIFEKIKKQIIFYTDECKDYKNYNILVNIKIDMFNQIEYLLHNAEVICPPSYNELYKNYIIYDNEKFIILFV